MDPGHVRLERLNGGAPLLKVHDRFALESVIGSVVPARRGSRMVRASPASDSATARMSCRSGPTLTGTPVRQIASSPMLLSAKITSTAAGTPTQLGQKLPFSRTRPMVSPAPLPTASVAVPISVLPESGLGRLLGGVVPIDPVAGRPGLRADLGQVEHADERCLDGRAAERRPGRDTEVGADQQPVARVHVVGRGERDGTGFSSPARSRHRISAAAPCRSPATMPRFGPRSPLRIRWTPESPLRPL